MSLGGIYRTENIEQKIQNNGPIAKTKKEQRNRFKEKKKREKQVKKKIDDKTVLKYTKSRIFLNQYRKIA